MVKLLCKPFNFKANLVHGFIFISGKSYYYISPLLSSSIDCCQADSHGHNIHSVQHTDSVQCALIEHCTLYTVQVAHYQVHGTLNIINSSLDTKLKTEYFTPYTINLTNNSTLSTVNYTH